MVPIHLLVAPPPLPCYQTNRRGSSSLVVLLGLELGGGVGHAHAQLLGALDDLLALAGRHVVRDLGRVLPERHKHTQAGKTKGQPSRILVWYREVRMDRHGGQRVGGPEGSVCN